MNTLSNESNRSGRVLKMLGASSWSDAALCLLVCTFLILMIVSFFTVVGTFVSSFFAGFAPFAS